MKNKYLKLLLFVVVSFFSFCFKVNASDISNYYININILNNGDIKVQEVRKLNGYYNGIITNLNYKNNNSISNTTFDFLYDNMYNADNITDIKVFDIAEPVFSREIFNNLNKEFIKVDNAEMGDYGVYTLTNNYNGFTIKTFLPSKYNSAQYLEYTIKNAVVVHNDVAEVFWNLLRNNNESIDDYNVWINLPDKSETQRIFLHGGVGTSKIVDNKIYEIHYNNISSYTDISYRIVFDKNIVSGSNKLSEVDGLESILKTEEEIYNSNNIPNYDNYIKEKNNETKYMIVLIIMIISSVSFLIHMFLKPRKKKQKQYTNYIDLSIKNNDLYNNSDYCRDIPFEYGPEIVDMLKHDGKITKCGISANILNLILKKIITVQKINNDYILNYTGSEVMKNNMELCIIHYLFGNELSNKLSNIKNFPKYKHYELYTNILSNIPDNFHDDIYSNKHDKKRIILLIIATLILLVLFNPYTLIFVLLFSFTSHTKKIIFIYCLGIGLSIVLFIKSFRNKKKVNLNYYTKLGLEHYNKWNKFEEFLLDFSNIKNKTILDVYLYEKYLVYAVALDIADKVIKEIKIPNINLELYNELISITSDIGNSVEKEYNSYVRQNRVYSSDDDNDTNYDNSSSLGFGGDSSSDGGSYGGGGTSTGRF